MPNNAKPRKGYKPRRINAPITDSLAREFEMDLRFGLMALQHGSSSEGWESLGGAINVLGMAHHLCKTREAKVGAAAYQAERRVIDSAVRTMNDVEQRASRLSTWYVSEIEAQTIAGGINLLMSLVHSFGVRDIYEAWVAIRAQREAEKLAAQRLVA